MTSKTNTLSPLVSIIIRTKNEERWIEHCLSAIAEQTLKDFEIILVDNNSDDWSVKIAKKYTKKIVTVTDFFPGKAINEGIRASSGQYIVIVSGHCIPKNNQWLKKLIDPFLKDKTQLLAGVYGRQEPLSSSSPLDKRDLTVVFGLDERIQKKDSFFHNANSALPRRIWEKFPFDENTTNIEDRLWGAEVTKNGYHIFYTPEASVYHYHGINQGGKIDRAEKIVKIIETLEGPAVSLSNIVRDRLNIIGLIPVKGSATIYNKENLLIKSIEFLKSSKLVEEVYISTDNEHTANLAKKNGALAPFIRPSHLSSPSVGLPEVLKFSLDEIEKIRKVDLVVIIEENYPFRPDGLVDNLINSIIEGGYDTVCASIIEERSIWLDENERITAIGDSLMESRKIKNEKVHINLFGLGAVTYVDNIRRRNILTNKVGLSPVPSYPYSFQINLEEK